MRSGLGFYKKDTAYRMMKKAMTERCGKEQTEQIWAKAGRELEQLWLTYSDVPKAERMHTHNEIFPRVAMYRVLQQEMPEQAMAVMDEAVKMAGTAAGELIRGITSLPGMPRLFLRIMVWMLKKVYSPPAGFAQHFYQTGRDEVRFDITACPYCKYCALCGCPELTRNFCDSDVYCFGDLQGVRFERTQTLGTGGSCCDFRFQLDRRQRGGQG